MIQKITSEDELHEYIKKSKERSVFLFKHSTRCPVSAMAFSEFEQFSLSHEEVHTAYILVIEHRPVSSMLAEITNITHQSPQVIHFKDEQVRWHASHHAINQDALERQIENP